MILAAFLLDFSVSCGLIATPFLASALLQAGPGLTGTLGALQMALYAAGCLLSAYFLRGRQLSLWWAIAGVSGFALLYACLPAAGNSVVFIFVATLPFVGLAFAWPAMQAWVGSEPDTAARGRTLAWFNTATAFGFTVSPLFVGPLFDYDVRGPFAGLLVVGCLAVALLLSLPRCASVSALEQITEDKQVSEQSRSLSCGLLYASWCATCVANALVTSIRSIYPKQMEALVGANELTLFGNYRPSWLNATGAATNFSWLAFLLSFSTVVGFLVLGRTTRWQYRFSWILGGQVIAACAFALMGSTKSLGVMLICFAIQGANFGLSFFASLYYSLAVAAKGQSRAAINEGALGTGGFIGGVGVGFLAEHTGIARALHWVPAAVLFALLAQLWLLRQFRTINA
jgi:MFS family permease